MKVWLVNMGIDDKVEDTQPIRAFRRKQDAINFVIMHLEEDIAYLKKKLKEDNIHVTIGNSFYIYSMEVEEKV